MCDQNVFRPRALVTAVCAAAALSVFGPSPVRAQTTLTSAEAGAAAAQSVAAQGPVRRLSIDESVALALEQNLDLQVERINPQVQDYSISVARSNWVPNFQSQFTGRTQENPPQDIFSGDVTSVSDNRLTTQTVGSTSVGPFQHRWQHNGERYTGTVRGTAENGWPAAPVRLTNRLPSK